MNKAEAKKLLDRYKNGQCTPSEKERVEAWFDHLSQSQHWEWDGLDKVKFGAQLKENIEKKINQPKKGRLVSFTRISIAASLLFISGLLFFGVHYQNRLTGGVGNTAYTETYALPGHRVKVTLSDGSTILLNGSSRLRYPTNFGKSTREVTLVQGEAYFDIRHDDKKMFVVEALGTRTYVLGTAFNIRAYKGAAEVQVTVTRGKVAVRGRSNLTGTISAAPVMLLPDDQATFVKATGNISQKHINAADYTVWIQGKYKFNNESLGNVAIVLENAFNVHISFTKDELKDIRFSSEFDSTDKLEDLLFAICRANNLTYTPRGRDVILSEKHTNR